jgi:hypothetical protein
VLAARGDFVAFLDADDVYAPDHLRALGWASAARPDLDILTADAAFVRDGAVRGSFYQSNPFPLEDQRLAVLSRCFLHADSAVRRSRLLDVDGFDESLVHGEDWDLWIRLVLTGSQAGLVDHTLVEYRLHDSQLSAALVASYGSRPRVLVKTLNRSDLSPAERDVTTATLRRARRRAAQVGATELRGAAARRSWWILATSRETAPRMRVTALAGVVAPVWTAGRVGWSDPGRRFRSAAPNGNEEPRPRRTPRQTMPFERDGGAQQRDE